MSELTDTEIWDAYIENNKESPDSANDLYQFCQEKEIQRNATSISYKQARSIFNAIKNGGTAQSKDSMSTFMNTQSKGKSNASFPNISIFKSMTKTPRKCKDHKECPALQRLEVTLRYYSNLDIVNNEQNQNIFIDFTSNIHTNLIDDYIHFIQAHGNQIEEIHNHFVEEREFGECSMAKCTFTSRHHETNTADNKPQKDSILTFYKQTLDSLHFYLFHIFDAGLRSLSATLQQDQGGIKSDDEYYDHAFSRIKTAIHEKKKNIDPFRRFTTTQNSKFSIKAVNDVNDDYVQDDDETSSDTFIDSLYAHLSTKGIDEGIINDLHKFLLLEQYETDTVDIDIKQLTVKGNILQHIEDQKTRAIVIAYFKSANKSVGSFNIGLRFYYWDFYKNLAKLPRDEQGNGFITDHSGYKISELYVNKKYASFGEEILNYDHVESDIVEFKKLIMTKAEKYLQCKVAKSIRSFRDRYAPQHYDIWSGTTLTMENLLSLILYTDTTALSSKFSASFRKTHAYETLSHIKSRNSKYWWWSRRLRETVEIFGSATGERSKCKGPFYTGISVELNLPSFSIRLCSPTSTSLQIAVATTFSGQKGLILQLCTNEMVQKNYNNLKAFDVSWISNFKEEDERLFFGGSHCIAIQSVRLMKTTKNYKMVAEVLYCFDAFLSGIDSAMECWHKMTPYHEQILQRLMRKYSKNDDDDGEPANMDEYIYKTFESFINNKDELYIDWPVIFSAHSNEKMRYMVIYPSQKGETKWVPFTPKEKGDKTNLFRREILEVFNPKKIIFKLYHNYGSVTIDLWSLLSIIENHEIEEVILLLGFSKDFDKFKNGINPITSELKEAYNEANYDISDLKINYNSEDKHIECVIKYKA